MDPEPRATHAPVTDAEAMQEALRCAHRAAEQGEVPVGAVVVHQGRIVGTGHNTPISDHDPSAHAEINAMRDAASRLGNYRLESCTLYVTLEPCAMCAGAILNARIGRVVFAAADPRAGAAGSVINLFDKPQLNHRTRVEGGLLASQARAVLQAFFRARRHPNTHPLREDALRTPDAAFQNLPDYPWAPQYVSDLPALDGLRLHYVDAGPAHATRPWLLLHDSPLWSYAFRHLIHALVAHGQRVLAPDLPGFGKSDKPKRECAQGLVWRTRVLRELAERLGLEQVIVVGHGLGRQLAARLITSAPTRFAHLLVLDPADLSRQGSRSQHATPDPVEQRAWAAPFPNAGYRAAPRSRAGMDAIPTTPTPDPWPGSILGIRSNGPDGPLVYALEAQPAQAPTARSNPPAWLRSTDAASAVVAQTLALLEQD